MKQYLFLSVHDLQLRKAIGAVVIELPEGVQVKGPFDVAAFLVEPEGEDVRDMPSGVFFSRADLDKLNYKSTHHERVHDRTSPIGKPSLN